ncbi:hypothetical protein DNTS_021416 [Danionella cerebrum]|uniref:Uncharacterized protein n=1 Tax=Danionella cerebrum TaxID=2873325 RepID=A0A553R135_9TELE|nr:hypothetical protein DNTS_021416 [Danionella translucida]
MTIVNQCRSRGTGRPHCTQQDMYGSRLTDEFFLPSPGAFGWSMEMMRMKTEAQVFEQLAASGAPSALQDAREAQNSSE